MSFTVPNRIKSRLKKGLLALITIYILLGVFLFAYQKSMIFQPWYLPQDYVYEFENKFEELFLNSGDEAIINALYFRADQPKGVVLYFHGNAGHLQRWGELTQHFIEKGQDLFIIDYRSYGKSRGEISEQALYEDAQMCYELLKDNYSESEITVYGRSLGSGVACYIAANNSPKQLLLEAPFYCLADVAGGRFPIYPVKSLLQYEFPNYKHLQQATCPIHIFHGTDDFIVPYDSGSKLFNALKNKDVQFYTIEGGGHSDLIEFDYFEKKLAELLE